MSYIASQMMIRVWAGMPGGEVVINRVFKGGLHLEDNIGVKMEGGRA